MITCPYCQHKLLEGTIFCPECGASLVTEEEPVPTSPFPVPEDRLEPSLEAEGRTTAHIAMAQLRLLVLNSGRMIACPQKEVVLVGRSDPASDVFPDADLTPDNGYMAGVSRRHARIIRRGDEFFVEDLNSINGTFLNRQKLTANTLVPFQDGDEIRLGNLVLRIILETNSV